MRFLYLLALLSTFFLSYAAGDEISDTNIMEAGSAANPSGKDQQEAPVSTINSELSAQLLAEITQNQALAAKLELDAQNLKQPEKQSRQKVDPGFALSEDDKSALNSPIFTPGGAPRPAPQEKPSVNSLKSSKDDEKDSDKDKPDNTENTTTEDNSATTDSDSGTSSSLPSTNDYNNNNPTYPPSSSTGKITLKATFKPQNGKYQYKIAPQGGAGENPFANVDADHSLKLSINGSYTKIKITGVAGGANHNLPWTITANPLGAAADNDYSRQPITVGNNTENFKVPSISAQLTKTDGSTQNIQFLFYNTGLSCTQPGGAGNNLQCTIPTSGASFVINKIQ